MNYRNIALFLFFSLTACDHNEAVNPVVITDDPPQLGTTSAVIEGNIKETGSIRPIKYGFLWDSLSGLNILTAKHRIDLGPTDVNRIYQVALTGLTPNTQYFVRAYAASTDYSKIYYGNEIQFKTLP